MEAEYQTRRGRPAKSKYIGAPEIAGIFGKTSKTAIGWIERGFFGPYTLLPSSRGKGTEKVVLRETFEEFEKKRTVRI